MVVLTKRPKGFRHVRSFRKKTLANIEARILRKEGYQARVVKEKDLHLSEGGRAFFWFTVYKKGRRKTHYLGRK